MKRTRLKRRSWIRKASPKRRMELQLDHAARLACLMAAGGRCERCGATDGPLEWHHVITRRVRSLRWHPDNALALCLPCHRWWHAKPRDARGWFVERFGAARMATLLSIREEGK